jgi:hypothetical protein
MGVASSGATLEIQLVADVARLKRDMDAMKSTVASATSGVEASFAKVGGTTGQVATQMALAAQTSARAAVGIKAVGMSANSARIVQMEMFHVTKALTEQIAMGVNPARAFAMEIGRIGTAVQYSGGIKGLISSFSGFLGIIKVTKNAELEEAAAASAANAEGIRRVAERAAATVQARQTQVALAQAQLAAADSAEAEAVAQGRLVKALRSVETSAAQAAIANDALATAEAEAGVAAEAAAAAQTVALGPMAIALAGIVAVAGVAFGAMKQFQGQVKDSGELTRFRDGLGLTRKEMEQLSDGVEKVGGHIKTLGPVTVTMGDIVHGVFQTIANDASDPRLNSEWGKMKAGATVAFNGILEAWGYVSAGISAGLWGTFNFVNAVWKRFPQVLGDIFVQAVNAAIKAINGLVTAAVSGVNWFIDHINAIAGKKLIDNVAPPEGIKEIQNRWAGSAAAAGHEMVNAYSKSWGQARALDKKFWHDSGENAKQSYKDRASAEAAALKANETAKKQPKGKHPGDHGLQDALDELDAQIKGQWDLASAYQVSDAAVMKAEALQKAEEQAIRHKGEVGIFYEKELAKAVATRAAEGAKTLSDLRFETDARKGVNDAVASGRLTAAEANQQLQLEKTLRPLVAAAAVAEGKAKRALLNLIRDITEATAKSNAEISREAALRDEAANDNNIEKLRLEGQLIGASNRERAVALAQLEAEQKLRTMPGMSPAEQQRYVQSYVDAANAAVRTPFQQWAESVPQDAKAITDSLDSIAFKGFDSLSSAISDVVLGTKSLKAAFSEVAKSIIADIIQMTVKMLLFRAVSAIFGGNHASAGGGDIFSAFEESSGGGGFGIPRLAGGGFGVIGGMGGTDSNLLSLNGRPVAWVSNGEGIAVGPTGGKGGASGGNSHVIVELRGDIDARIAAGANVQIIRAAPLLRSDAMRAVSEGNRRR